MKIEIQPPDDVIEASYSTDPDDVSVVSIRIVATPETASESLDDVTSLEFVIPPELSTNAASITPQAQNFADWEMQPAGDRMVARPRRPWNSVPKDGWVFHLRDVEVVDSPGRAEITVEEHRTDKTASCQHTIAVRKVHPSLRIDHFHAVDPRGDPLDASTTSTTPLTLSWATTAADTVSLWGPSIDGLRVRGGAVSDDDSVTIRPETTSVYTLVASNASSHTVGQVTVTVTDQTVVRNLKMPQGSLELRHCKPDNLTTNTAYLQNRANNSFLVLSDHDETRPPATPRDQLSFSLRGIGKIEKNKKRCQLNISYDGESPPAVLNYSGTWEQGSDAHLKERILDLPEVLDGVRDLRPVTFAWKGKDATNVGFVAQEVEEIFPHLVGSTMDSEGEEQRTLAYSGFGVLAIAAIQELAKDSETRIAALEKRVAELTERLDRQQES